MDCCAMLANMQAIIQGKMVCGSIWPKAKGWPNGIMACMACAGAVTGASGAGAGLSLIHI